MSTFKKLLTNIQYGCSQGLYWMLYCATLCFASAYLESRGYTTTQTGTLMGIAFLASFFLQQISAAIAEGNGKISLPAIIIAMEVALLGCQLGMVFIGERSLALSVVFVLAAIVVMTTQPLFNALAFYVDRDGKVINYGACRAFGSVFFSILSSIIGHLINSFGVNSCAWCGFVAGLFMVALLLWISFSHKEEEPVAGRENSSKEKQPNLAETYVILFKKYKLFFLYEVGATMFFFGHVVVNNFFFQIVENVGGNAADQGYLLAFAAIVEVPAMVGCASLKKRFGIKPLIIVSSVFFSVKMILTTLAGSVPMLYFAMAFQMPALALWMPAGVLFAAEIMDDEDIFKGQALNTSSIALANFLGSMLAGTMIQNFGVDTTLVMGDVVSVAGSAIAVLAVCLIYRGRDKRTNP